MSKIKITSKEQIIEGNLIDNVVKPFGNSAHIPISKKHTGKKIGVVVPEEPFYAWVLNKEKGKRFLAKAKQLNKRKGGKLEFHTRECIQRIEEGNFKIEDLEKIYELIAEAEPKNLIIKELKRVYNL